MTNGFTVVATLAALVHGEVPPDLRQEMIDKARIKVEADRVRLQKDKEENADRRILEADEMQLDTDIHVLSNLARERNRELSRSQGREQGRRTSSDMSVDTP
jgi:hypothetical protein